ncbi:hypothetical protein [Actinophytocola sp.]|uniref:hypothetical protein n=1 Tax=Actinophytocola sp. TaxID=1872138 RepID=UPI002ED1D194
MTQTTETTIDRYITIFDRSAHDPDALEELRTIFAPDATVQLDDGMEPITGFTVIMEIYQGIARNMADSKHFWTTTELPDGTLECHWVQAARAADGRLVTQSGIEHATLDADGLITNLHNKMVPAGSWV